MISYFNIQRSCLRDGPGIRTTLFLKGCPLRCLWCHNPEGQSFEKELIFRRDRCTGCGRCLSVCSARTREGETVALDRGKCTACGRCAEVCLADCCEICGAEAPADEIYEKLVRDRPYFENSGGGITVSGGEPLSQPEAVLCLAKRAADDGVGFAVETSGYGDAATLLRLASLGCLFLYDIKGIDPEKHLINTGVSNESILSNLAALTGAGADVILRLPLIPGYNDSNRDLDLLTEHLSKYREKIGRAEIMPFHRIGIGKSAYIGRDNGELRSVPDGKAFSEEWKSRLEASGAEVIVN